MDNGAMIAWNAWEVKNAQQDVDIRNEFVKGHSKVPLGNFRIDQQSKKQKHMEVKWNNF